MTPPDPHEAIEAQRLPLMRRLTHWLAILIMIGSGWRIYNDVRSCRSASGSGPSSAAICNIPATSMASPAPPTPYCGI